MELKDIPNEELDRIELDERRKLQAAQLQMQILSSQENLRVVSLEKQRRSKEAKDKPKKKKNQ